MKLRDYIPLILFPIVLILSFSVLFFIYSIHSTKLTNLIEPQAKIIINELNQYYQINNEYPADIEKYLDSKNIKYQFKSFIYERKINFYQDENKYKLDYYYGSMGPYECYDSKLNEWYNEE